VAASLAYDCLKSVPLNKAAAIDLVDALEPYLEWQSDAAYKADPPADYFYPPVDIFAALAKVRANLVADKYAGEYDFQLDLYVTVFGPGHDGHYVFYPDALTKVFQWTRQRSLVSVSEDGSSLPVIKLYEDVVSSPKTASVVTKINGIDAAKYVQDTIFKASFNQDADAAYNSMFFELASVAANGAGQNGYFSNGGRIRYIYQGANTTFTFANGTELTVENQATVKADLTGVTDGASFYAKFCTVPKPTAADSNTGGHSIAASTKRDNGAAGVPGYPQPVIMTSDAIVAGFYLNGTGVEDVAVLSLFAFESESPAEFQAVVSDFLAEAKAAGKKKLVVDLQANGGGYILLGYDFFRQLFPHLEQDGYSRWKNAEIFNSIAKIFSAQVEGLNPFTSNDTVLIEAYETWFNWRYDLNLTDGAFTSFDDKFAPQVFKNTPYTALMRWNLSDPLTTINDTFGMGIDISGYGKLTNLTQPFAPEDIVLLYDGACASTCTLASEMLRIHAGVKSVMFGGRPTAGPVQAVGGIKGSQVLQFNNIFSYAKRALSGNVKPTSQELSALNRITDLPIRRSSSAAVNTRDQILRGNVKDGLPAQFVTEYADCRLYWTEKMVTDVSEIWTAAANSAFNNAKCANGGIQYTKHNRRGQRPALPAQPQPVQRRRLSEMVDKTVKLPTDNLDWLALHRLAPIE
jgi:hypothetical protein